MAYVPVPKDLNAVKTKVLLNLTKRQLVCFGAGAALGVPLFFLLKAHTGRQHGGHLHDPAHAALFSAGHV